VLLIVIHDYYLTYSLPALSSSKVSESRLLAGCPGNRHT